MNARFNLAICWRQLQSDCTCTLYMYKYMHMYLRTYACMQITVSHDNVFSVL